MAVDVRAHLIARLGAAGCIAPEEEAEALLAAAPSRAVAHLGPLEAVEPLVRRREAGEPLEWIVGSARFGGLRIAVAPGVYVPRPQSEELARRAASVLPAGDRLLDLATGSGAVAARVASLVPTAAVVGLDLSPVAVRWATANGVASVVADLGAAPVRTRSVDVVVAVAPYVPTPALRLLPADVQRHEPRLALDGGPDGLALVRRVVATASRVLRPGGHLLVELGGSQASDLAPDLADRGFAPVETWHDEEGDLRGLHTRLHR